jgi:phosphoribosylformimino-5-aminoimidazole carboxamide ribotide isomerase
VRVIGVVDLQHGRAVHARQGIRDQYQPVSSVAGVSIDPGDALALARAYIQDLGVDEIYVADLDAILGRPPQDTCVTALAALAPVWLDAGVSSSGAARRAAGLGAAQVVVGLETLSSYDALAEICAAVGGNRVAFSVDLRDGEPVRATIGAAPGEAQHVLAPHVLAAHAAGLGVGTVIVLDLARVGSSAGIDLGLIARVREATPGVTLLAGGGLRGGQDLRRLADAGCDGALVATALLDGRIGAPELAAARLLGHGAIRLSSNSRNG